jgi:hypothetical protein
MGGGSGHDRRIVLSLVLCALISAGVPVGAAAQPAPATSAADAVSRDPWFRVFLLDGQIVSTLGEFTRVDDVVVLQVPLGVPDAGGVAHTRTITLAASSVDWARTDAYREAVRRTQFEAAGGERAYAAFTEEVAATLRDVALIPDALERIRRLEAARLRLAQWPAAHHGHRAADVAQTLSVVDDLLNGMRAAAGQQAFSLALTTAPAAPTAPPPASLLPPPTLQDMITQALGLAPRVTDATERLQLLQSAEALLASAPAVDRRWARTTGRQIRRQIRDEASVTRRYERLRDWMLEKTSRLLARADVRGLMQVREDVLARDARLRRQRPADVASLLATLDLRLDTARRQRLLLERWHERRPALDAYATTVTPFLSPTAALSQALEEIKALSGPDPDVLARAERLLGAARADATRSVPEEARATQQLWLSAQQLATRAVLTRRAAVRSGDLQQAWDASAAAAGALMLLQQLRTDVPALLRPPSLPGSTGS